MWCDIECYADVVTDHSLAVPTERRSNEDVLDKVVSESFSEGIKK